MKLSPYGHGSPIPLIKFFRDKFHAEILTGSPGAGASNKGEVGENKPFSSLKHQKSGKP